MPAVIITGGTGLIGKNLTRHLRHKGYEVIVFTRFPAKHEAQPGLTYAAWNVEEQSIDAEPFARAEYIIHLAGAGVMEKKWTPKYKREIEESRTQSSGLLVRALQQHPNKIKAVVSASAIGWYGANPVKGFGGFTETDKADAGFLGETCVLWEQSIEPVTQFGKRLAKLRLGIVLSNEGGAFIELIKSLKVGIASILGSGRQVISWVHIDDICRMFIYALENENVSGSYNAVAPEPVTNKDMILRTARLMRGSFFIPVHVPKFMLRLILGSRSVEILKSATVKNNKIKESGFTFLYPTLEPALEQLTGKEL